MAEETEAAFPGSRAGHGYTVKGSPEMSVVIVSPCAAQSAIPCQWLTVPA